MGYTAHGRQQRANLQKASQIGKDMLALFRPIVATIPKVVSERTKSTGAGAGGTYSKYSTDWAKKRSARGLQTSKKDFWFNGRMWDSYKITKEEVTDVGVRFILSSDTADAHNGGYLVDIHSDNQNQNILEVTDEEWDNIVDQMWDAFNKATSGLFK